MQGINTLLLLFHDGELAAQLRSQGIEPMILPDRNQALVKTARRLADILRQHKIQIVHIHGYKAMVFCALTRYWYPFAMVKTEHGLPEPMEGRTMMALRERLYRQLDSIITRFLGVPVCYVSRELMTHYQRKHAGLQNWIITNGPERIDPSQLQVPPELQQDRFNLVVVARLETVKGVHFAIDAVADCSLPDLQLYVVGTGPCEPQLKAQAFARGIAPQVHFLGFRRNAYDYIAHADALLMPSLHEGLPYTLLEAMSLGVPIIASRVGGLAEVLMDGVTGLLVPPADSKVFAQAIVRLHNDTVLRRQLGREAQRVQQTGYSLEAMTLHYLQVYRHLLQATN
jgi:glycosyltransferase involved in cell wall biosynthesis